MFNCNFEEIALLNMKTFGVNIFLQLNLQTNLAYQRINRVLDIEVTFLMKPNAWETL